MRFATIFAAVVSTSASLVVRQSIPGCYDTCAAKQDLNGCSATDTGCLCRNSAFVKAATQCIETTCTGSDLQAALTAAQQICEAVGVTLTASSTLAGSSTVSSTGSRSPTSTSSSGSALATASTAAAATHGANAFIGLAAVGLVALAL